MPSHKTQKKKKCCRRPKTTIRCGGSGRPKKTTRKNKKKVGKRRVRVVKARTQRKVKGGTGPISIVNTMSQIGDSLSYHLSATHAAITGNEPPTNPLPFHDQYNNNT